MNNKNYHITIKKLAKDEQPREKIVNKGISSLSNTELIAILLRTGNTALNAIELAKIILNNAENNLNKLARFNFNDFTKFEGMGITKAATIMCAFELGRRRHLDNEERIRISCSSDVYNLFKQNMLDISHEEFWILTLSRSNSVIRKTQISKGGFSSTAVDPKVVFKNALDQKASSIICIHNHPSGNINPSKEDIELTNKLKEGAKLLDIAILDHLIFADKGYFSFLDSQMI